MTRARADRQHQPTGQTIEATSAGVGAAVTASPADALVSRAGGFVDTVEAWGYEHPQSMRAYQRLRDAWRAAEVLSPEDADDDTIATVQPLLRVVDGGDDGRANREGRA